jgi:hypothetical protein
MECVYQTIELCAGYLHLILNDKYAYVETREWMIGFGHLGRPRKCHHSDGSTN